MNPGRGFWSVKALPFCSSSISVAYSKMQNRTYVLGVVCLTAQSFLSPFINNELSSSLKQRNQARKYLISERKNLYAINKLGAVWK